MITTEFNHRSIQVNTVLSNSNLLEDPPIFKEGGLISGLKP